MSKNSMLGNINYKNSILNLDNISLWVNVCKYNKYQLGFALGRAYAIRGSKHVYTPEKNINGMSGELFESKLSNTSFFQYGFYLSYLFSDKLKSNQSVSLFVSLMSHKTWYPDGGFPGSYTGDGYFDTSYKADTTYSRTMGFCMQVRYEKVFKYKGKERVGLYVAYQQGFRTIGAINARSYLQSYDHTNDQELISRAITKGSGFYVGVNFPIQLKKKTRK